MVTHQTDRVGFAFNRLGQVTAETHFEGLLPGIAVGSGFDAAGRRESLSVTQGGNPIYQASYAYAGDLLQTVGYGNLLATYQYEPSSALLKSITFSQNGQNRLTLTRFYDTLNRLTKIEAVANGQTINSQHSYGYNLANQRTVVTNADNSRWNFEYDDLGQVISGKKRWADANPVLGQQFEYEFDDIGNRLWAKTGGDSSGQNLRQSDYVPNLLNQYLSRTVPGFTEVQGSAGVGATVTVNHAPTERQGEYYRKELAAANAGQPVWLSVTNMAVVNQPAKDVITTTEGRLYVPPATESFTYDLDGNLTADGRWEYAWDAENRLIGMETAPGAAAAGVPKEKLVFQYDWQGRRIAKTVYEWQTDHWSLTSDLRFVYDGWNLVAILDGNSQLLYSFVWGTDLSGKMQGAGGVGGLLSMTIHAGSQAGDYFYCYDGNGNVVALINAQSSELSARYEYGPFGELIRATGPLAKANPFRFSTKYQDDETDLLYYGYRYYDPNSGRWLSRDLIAERGGMNLYGFASNRPISSVDPLGLFTGYPTWDKYSGWSTEDRLEYAQGVVTTFQGMGQGALTVGKEVGYFAGDLLLGYVMVVTRNCCCNSLLTKLDEMGYKGSSLTAGAGGEYGGIKTSGKVFVAPVVAAVSVPVNGYKGIRTALDGDLNTAGNYVGQGLATGGLLAAPFAKGTGGTGGYTGVGTWSEAVYNLSPTLFGKLPAATRVNIIRQANRTCEASLIKDMGADAVSQFQVYPRLQNGKLATWWYTADGVCTRGGLQIREFKASPTAELTGNQPYALPLLRGYGGAVRSLKGTEIGLPQGTLLPPIRVRIVRQDQFQPSELVLRALGDENSQ